MKRASITIAKNQLSALLDRVRHGETVVIEDRGIPIARIIPIDRTAGPDRDHLVHLERQGILRPPRASRSSPLLRSAPPPPARQVALSRIARRERREGW